MRTGHFGVVLFNTMFDVPKLNEPWEWPESCADADFTARGPGIFDKGEKSWFTMFTLERMKKRQEKHITLAALALTACILLYYDPVCRLY